VVDSFRSFDPRTIACSALAGRNTIEEVGRCGVGCWLPCS
jgi:hypothetical protein